MRPLRKAAVPAAANLSRPLRWAKWRASTTYISLFSMPPLMLISLLLVPSTSVCRRQHASLLPFPLWQRFPQQLPVRRGVRAGATAAEGADTAAGGEAGQGEAEKEKKKEKKRSYGSGNIKLGVTSPA